MNKYTTWRTAHEKIINTFINEHAFFAFSKEQMDEGLAQFKSRLKTEDGTRLDTLSQLGGGGYILTSKAKQMEQLFNEMDAAKQASIHADLDGTGFILDMFNYELANHEFDITGDISDTLNACDITQEQLKRPNSENLRKGLKLALKRYQ